MERIRQLLSEIEVFTGPSRLLVIDFWSQAEDARANQDGALQQYASIIASLRPNTVSSSLHCTEEAIWQLPILVAEHQPDGVVLLPPLGRHQGTRAIVASLQQRLVALDHQGGLSSDVRESSVTDSTLSVFWSSAPPMVRKQRDLEAFVVATTMSAMPSGSAFLLLSAPSLLDSDAMLDLRATIHRESGVNYVIEFGGEWLGIHASLSLCGVAFVLGRGGEPIVRLFKYPNSADASLNEIAADFRRLKRQGGGTTNYGYVLRNGLPPGDNWRVDANHPRWDRYLDALRTTGDVSELATLGTLSSYNGFPGQIGPAITDWPVLGGRQILPDGTFDLEVADVQDGTPAKYWQGGQPPDAMQLLPGDVCIPRIFEPTPNRLGRRAAVFPQGAGTWYLGPNLMRFRFNANIKELVRAFVVAYLRSPQAAGWLAARSSSIWIGRYQLSQLPVPLPDESTQAALDRLVRAKGTFELWARRLSDLQNDLFSFASPQESRLKLLEEGARAEQRLAAAEAVETLSWRVRNLFPHPLAFRWRSAEIQTEGNDKYLALLEAAESCIAFVALMGCIICEVVADGRQISYLATVIERLRQRPDSGVSLGDWIAILRELNTAQRFDSVGPSTPFFEVCSFLRENAHLDDAITRLKVKRDAFAHHRRPSEGELPSAIQEVATDLETLVSKIDFLTRYPLRDILFTQPVGRQSRGTYRCKDLTGDHPIPSVKTCDYEGPAPAVGVHVIDQFGFAHLAEPWLVRRRCENCGFEETFVFDRYLRDRSIRFKSLERGHEEDMGGRRDELRHVGIDLPL